MKMVLLRIKIELQKFSEKYAPFLCPSCKKRRWLPAKKRWYKVERLNQNIQGNVEHCYKCAKAMKQIINSMK